MGGNYVVEQDVLRYNKLSNEILPTAMTPSVPSSEQNKKNVATKNPVSPVISVSDVTESEVLSNKPMEKNPVNLSLLLSKKKKNKAKLLLRKAKRTKRRMKN